MKVVSFPVEDELISRTFRHIHSQRNFHIRNGLNTLQPQEDIIHKYKQVIGELPSKISLKAFPSCNKSQEVISISKNQSHSLISSKETGGQKDMLEYSWSSNGFVACAGRHNSGSPCQLSECPRAFSGQQLPGFELLAKMYKDKDVHTAKDCKY